MVFKTRHVAVSLCAKGFREDHKRDHRYYFFYHQGKKSSIQTKISHNADEIDDYLCSAMSRQMRLTRDQFKKFVMDGFPWEEIEKKKELIADFIDEQGKLLTFYDKNWGSWTTSTNPNKPEFTSASAASIYKRLRDQILNTSEQIEKEYKAMSE